MDRRTFLVGVPATLALLRGNLLAETTKPASILTVHPDDVIASMPHDFMGLSYESTQLGEPEFFSPQNTGLIRLFRTLSPSGNLRLGGNTSEFSYFKAAPSTPPPAYTPLPTQPATLTPITPQALRNLRGFLDATGWNCIYGLNLGTATPERVAEEAAEVAQILGTKLKYFQIGNEPNNYIRYKLRPTTWNASAYIDEWLPFAQAVLKRVPHSRVSGPDMGAEREWMELFAQRVPPILGDRLAEITDHFYAEGPPTSPASTIEALLHNKKILPEIAVMQSAGKLAHLPYRMTEVNSCYLGGKPGVSNTMASALWAGELTLRLLAAGFSGINFHGGSARQIKASLGGTLPGDDVAKASAADSYYTPIAGSQQEGFHARPIFYGMMLAAKMANGKLVRVSGSDGDNLIAYASLGGSGLRMALFNMTAAHHAVAIDASARYDEVVCQTLSAPAVDATTGIQFGAAEVDARGDFTATQSAQKLREGRNFEYQLAPFSAVMISFQHSSSSR
ncbi:hypothetical protein ACFQBQ_01015 [Granulicella cerasi]|uniref:Uncharacterized protein n=1 Tax=Granulicella cerasi TaxID=741063 RepID=A0ABW1Z4Z6_9BACT|nr:hypothetical protein [Granulicella cerasi]